MVSWTGRGERQRQEKPRREANPLVDKRHDENREGKIEPTKTSGWLQVQVRVVGPWLVLLHEQGQTLALLLSILESGRSAGVGNCKDGGRSQGSGN